MKICIFGNSHAAALKHGWDLIGADHPEVSVHIYSMLGQHLGDLELEGRRLLRREPSNVRLRSYPEEAGETVELDLYDGFILHGLGLKFQSQEGAVLSAAVRDATIVDNVEGSALWKLLGKIRKVSTAPARVGLSPLPAAEEVETRGPSGEYKEHVAKMQAACFDAMDAVFVAQPDASIVNGDMTDPKYNEDVVPLVKDLAETDSKNERHTDRDHMNPAFGALMLEQYLRSF